MAIALFLALHLLTLIFWSLLCRLGISLADVTDFKSYRIPLAAIVAVFGAQILNALFVMQMAKANMPPNVASIVAWFVQAGLWGSVSVLAISSIIRIPVARSIKVALPTFLAPAATLMLTVYLFKPFVFDAFVVPASSMAPTILGRHLSSVCEECGAPRYGGISPNSPMPDENTEFDMICENFHVTASPTPDKQVYSGDRVLVSKFRKPKRWDLVVFKIPFEPDVLFVKRLVGLPGETITIQDGAVYANGKELVLPPALNGLSYADSFETDWPGHVRLWGNVDKPAKLGEDEYFVLGDNTYNSADSRVWEEQYDDVHHPYGLPKENIIGVVSEIYWPISRWRSF